MASQTLGRTEIEYVILGELGDIAMLIIRDCSPVIYSVQCSGKNHVCVPTKTSVFG